MFEPRLVPFHTQSESQPFCFGTTPMTVGQLINQGSFATTSSTSLKLSSCSKYGSFGMANKSFSCTVKIQRWCIAPRCFREQPSSAGASWRETSEYLEGTLTKPLSATFGSCRTTTCGQNRRWISTDQSGGVWFSEFWNMTKLITFCEHQAGYCHVFNKQRPNDIQYVAIWYMDTCDFKEHTFTILYHFLYLKKNHADLSPTVMDLHHLFSFQGACGSVRSSSKCEVITKSNFPVTSTKRNLGGTLQVFHTKTGRSMVQEKINSLVSFSCSGGDWCGFSRSHIRH